VGSKKGPTPLPYIKSMQLSLMAGRTWAVALVSCVLAQAAPMAVPPPFSLDMVASNLMRYADQVPEEGWKDRLVSHSGCNCAEEQDNPYAEEANTDVDDADFQVAPSMAMLQAPFHSLSLVQGASQHRGTSRSGCNCGSKALSLATSGSAVTSGSGSEFDDKPTGIFLFKCSYSHADLLFWRLTNTAYLRGGIVLKETIAYTDTCKMCDYNNVACDKKKEVELTDGNCLCMWRMNGVEMQTALLACSSCVTECIGVYKTFDLGKDQPGMQKGVCLRKKPHKSFGDVKPLR
jgi:hypothetical protein